MALMYVGSVPSFPVGSMWWWRGLLHIEIIRKIIYLYIPVTRSISNGSPPPTLEWLGAYTVGLLTISREVLVALSARCVACIHISGLENIGLKTG